MLARGIVRPEVFDRVLQQVPRAVQAPDGGPLPGRLVVAGDLCSVVAPAGEGVYLRVTGLCLDEPRFDRVVVLGDLLEALGSGGDLDRLAPYPVDVVLPSPPPLTWIEAAHIETDGLHELFEDVDGLLDDARRRVQDAAAGLDLTEPASAAAFESALTDGLTKALQQPAAYLPFGGLDALPLPANLAFALRTFVPDADDVAFLSAGRWLLARVAGGFEAYLVGRRGGTVADSDAVADPSSR